VRLGARVGPPDQIAAIDDSRRHPEPSWPEQPPRQPRPLAKGAGVPEAAKSRRLEWRHGEVGGTKSSSTNIGAEPVSVDPTS
jgi:hypothetical protein